MCWLRGLLDALTWRTVPPIIVKSELLQLMEMLDRAGITFEIDVYRAVVGTGQTVIVHRQDTTIEFEFSPDGQLLTLGAWE